MPPIQPSWRLILLASWNAELNFEILSASIRYEEVIKSYDEVIEIRRRQVEDSKDGKASHFVALLEAYRLRAACLLSLHRLCDAVSTLHAAHDAFLSWLRSNFDECAKELVLAELEKHVELLKDVTDVDCANLIDNLKSCKKILLFTNCFPIVNSLSSESLIYRRSRQSIRW